MPRNKILYVGNFQGFSGENKIAEALTNLNQEVIKIQEGDKTAEGVLAVAQDMRPAMVFYTRTWGMKGDVLRLWARLKEIGIVSAGYHGDLYWGIAEREHKIAIDPWWRMQHVFTADGGHQEKFEKLGINHHWWRHCIMKKFCYRAIPDPALAFDVVFVGQYESYHPEWPFRVEMVEWLRKRYGKRFGLFGGGNPIVGHDKNRLYSSARVVVGDSINSPFYWTSRLVETIGRGGICVFPWVQGMRDFYRTPPSTFIPYTPGDIQDLERAIKQATTMRHEDRERMANDGVFVTRVHDTFEVRCRWMLDVVGLSQ